MLSYLTCLSIILTLFTIHLMAISLNFSLSNTLISQNTWPVQKVSDVIFSAETNEAREACFGMKVEGPFMSILGFFPASRQRQSRVASV